MLRALVCLLLIALVGQCQNPPAPPAGSQQSAPAARKSFLGSRRGLALLGGAIAGVGVALLATSGRSRQVPASNCSFYPAPFAPCVPAHTETTRSGVQNGIGGGMLVGGFVVVYVAIAR